MTDRTAESPVAAAAALAEATGVAAHDVAVMLGSGWRPAADLLGTPSHEIAMADLPAGFQNSATGADLRLQATCSYSLISPPRTDRRLIRWQSRPRTGWSGRGERSCSARCGSRPL
jgi:hypothetical protein